MKRRRRIFIVGFAAFLMLAGIGIATFRRSVEIDLESGMIRDLNSSMGFTLYRSLPKETTLSEALGDAHQPAKWLEIASEGFSFPRARIDFCYPRMFFHAGFFDRSFHNRRVSHLVAEAALAELAEFEDPCLVKDHLNNAWNMLGEIYDYSWTDSTIDSEITRVWNETKPNKP
jgi:hypothetical protein